MQNFIGLSRAQSLCAPLCGLALAGAALAEEPMRAHRATLQDVTVFLRGAQLLSTATVDLPAGNTDVVFSNVAGNINEQSLAVEADGGVIVLSSSMRNDFLGDEALSPQAAELKQQLEKLRFDKAHINNQIEVVKAQVAVMIGERPAAQTSSLSTVEMARMLDLIDKKMAPLLDSRLKAQQQIVRLDEQITKTEKQLAELLQKNLQPGGQITVRFHTEHATSCHVRLSYVVPDAGWVPAYDIGVKKAGAPVSFTYKGTVFQNSGISWNNVRLSLSTGNPAESAQAPELKPAYLHWYRPLPQQEVAMAQMAQQAPAPLQRGRQAPAQQQALDGYVTTNAEGIDTRFDISLPYSIPSDAKGHVVMIKSTELQGEYRYIATPKLDRDAFLQVRIANWERLNLLPGKSNIFFAGAFVGQGNIDPRMGKDTMNVSLGRDKNIIVTRKTDETNTGKPEFFGGDVRSAYAYSINVRNTRKNAVKLVVFDQIPVSRNSEVKVIDQSFDNDATYTADTGGLQWTLDLAPNESRTLRFGYSVKYPKDGQTVGL